MKTKFIPVEESFKQWKKDPKYVAAYDALEAEFVLASALIKARRCGYDAGAGCPSDGNHASRNCPPRKR
jgi:hypothetical protein